jgi:poly-beta-1,6-N-acetyl-D-glucosamine synthase
VGRELKDRLTVIVPAYNEAETLADTLRSLVRQTLLPSEIVVVDDCSTDETAEIAESFGVTVLRPPVNTGSKAGAQSFALDRVRTDLVMAVDADTTLAPDAIGLLLDAFDDPEVAAACGLVLPRRVATVWERGRYVEYLLAFSLFKRIQEYYGKPLISSGCFSIYRTAELRAIGGWSSRTLAEDVDLTWTLYAADRKVRFLPEAVGYPVEPHNLELIGKQLRRWSHGFIQNVRLHWRSVLHLGYLRSVVAVVFWDALLASLAYLMLIPVLAAAVDPPRATRLPCRCSRRARARGVAGVQPPRDRTSTRQLPELLRVAARQRALHAARGLARADRAAAAARVRQGTLRCRPDFPSSAWALSSASSRRLWRPSLSLGAPRGVRAALPAGTTWGGSSRSPWRSSPRSMSRCGSSTRLSPGSDFPN